ncbi:MAG: hypothetical protein GY906_11005 [bacterium]|nr:hypothetical protein [bacterium]
MQVQSNRACLVIAVMVFVGLITSTQRADAQTYQLYDKLSIALEGSFIALDTRIRADSIEHGIGTVINFESDLQMERGKMAPTVSLEWRPWKNHRFGLFFKDIDRDSTAQAATEIIFDDIVIPIGADVRLGYDIRELGIAYTYIYRPRERSSFGFGGGLRILEVGVSLFGRLEGEEGGGEWHDSVDATAPLPFIGVEYRYMFSEKWRFQTDLGVFYIEIADIIGFQALGRVTIEHLTFDNFAFGFGLGASNVDIDAANDWWRGALDLDIFDVRFFVRIRM